MLQVPEVCDWNPYVELVEQHLVARGVEVMRPRLCWDGPYVAPPRPPEIRSLPDIVHLHWPEMLASWYGTARALSVLQDMVARGARLVQTVHDLQPHEPSPELSTYFHDVDALTSGAHYFSDDHERQARFTRPKLPKLRTHLLHPAFPVLIAPARVTRALDRQVVLGCFGRIRPYKRFLAFGRAFGQAARPGFRLLIAGAAHSSEIHQELRQLARTYPCLTYLAGFLSEAEFAGALGRVDWVALPYELVYSSGVLVAAIQARKPILSPTPTGVEAYQLGPGLEAVDP